MTTRNSFDLEALRREHPPATTASRFAALRRTLGDGDYRKGGARLPEIHAAVLAACGQAVADALDNLLCDLRDDDDVHEDEVWAEIQRDLDAEEAPPDDEGDEGDEDDWYEDDWSDDDEDEDRLD